MLKNYYKRVLQSNFDSIMNITENKRFYDFYLDSILSYPKAGIIETTTRCNLRCIECARVVEKGPFEDMKYSTFIKLEELLKRLERVYLFGNGETFLNPDFEKMFLKAKSYNPWLSITTNATLFDDSMRKFLIDNGIDDIIFSIDAASKELFERIRRGAKYKDVVSNIRGFVEYAKRKGSKVTTSFQVVAMSMNIEEIPKLVKLASDLGVKSVSVIAMSEHNNLDVKSIRRSPEKGKEFIEKAKEIALRKNVNLLVTEPALLNDEEKPMCHFPVIPFRRKAKYLLKDLSGKPVSSIYYDKLLRNKMIDSKDVKFKLRDCHDPFEFIFVTVTGKVRICCVSPRTLGDFYTQTLDEIWFGKDLTEFRDNFLSGSLPVECVSCINRPWKEYNEVSDFIIMGYNDSFICSKATGWYEVERVDNKLIRWCSERGLLLLKNTGKKYMVIEFYIPFKEYLQQVEIFLDGNKITDVDIDSRGFHKKKIKIPEDIEGKYICVELYPDHILKPAEINPSSKDARELGTAISSVMLV